MLVNILLKDGTYLKNAVIFLTGNKGEHCIKNTDIIIEKFEEDCNFICFQTEMINGKFHSSNIETYEFNNEEQSK